MKSAKERKMERKRKNKEISVAKTVKSRQRRLDNKAKRDEIHAINPNIKVKVIDQVTYNEYGIEIMVENGKVKCVPTVKPETVEPEILLASDEGEVNVMTVKEVMEREGMIAPVEVEEVEVEDVNKFKKLLTKWRL